MSVGLTEEPSVAGVIAEALRVFSCVVRGGGLTHPNVSWADGRAVCGRSDRRGSGDLGCHL